MRLLWLTEKYPPARGGMAASCDRIVHGLRQQGITIDLVHFSSRHDRFKVERKQGGRLFICPRIEDSSHALNRVWNTLQLEQAGSYTHVVAFGGVLPLVAGPVFAAWLGAPFIPLMRGNDFDLSVFHPKRRELLADAFGRAAVVGVVSRDQQERIERLFPGVRVAHVPNGIDLAEWEAFDHHREAAASFRNGDRPVLGIIGQLKPKKGARFFLQALLDIGHAPNAEVLVVGDVDPALEEWIAEQDVPVRREPYCERDRLPAWYLACDFLVLPSFYDGLPNALLEAAGMSVPFIASSAGGMGDWLEDGLHGFLFPPGDDEGCRIAIDRAMRCDPEQRIAMGAACRALVEGPLSAEREIGNYLEVFSLP